MHSRKKGKSGSNKPSKEKKENWITYTPEEIEQLVTKIAKTSKTAAQIGIELRDRYGIPDTKKFTTKTITKILKENNLSQELPDDLTALIKKQINLMKHAEKNKHDQPAKRGIILTESKIRRLAKYYKRTGKLPETWKFTKEQAELLVS